MKLPCEVILDIIPLCRDGVASENSCQLVAEHILECESCRAEYYLDEEIQTLHDNTSIHNETLHNEVIFKRLRGSFCKMLIILLFIGALLGVSMTFSVNVFYNFLLMPFVGVLSFFALKDRFYFAPLIVMALSIFSNIIHSLISEGLVLSRVFSVVWSGVFYSMIFGVLTLLGGLIGWLLHYTFSKK